MKIYEKSSLLLQHLSTINSGVGINVTTEQIACRMSTHSLTVQLRTFHHKQTIIYNACLTHG